MTKPLTLFVLFAVFAVGTRVLPAEAQDDWDEQDTQVEIHGFVEGASGGRFVDDPIQPDALMLGEARFRLDLAHYGERAELYFKGDFLSDDIIDDTTIDIRQAVVLLRATHWLDIRAGRQVLTWGTGDFLFLNDLFPKDFVSFFVGRNDEYLKAPSTSFKVSLYANKVIFDIVWTPIFEADRFITGERLSYFDPVRAARTSAAVTGAALEAIEPKRTFGHGELAGRVSGILDGYELALYGYVGFWKEPTAFDAKSQMPTFGKLAVYGASARGNLAGGIAHVEGAYYDSYKDRDGENPRLPNSQGRGLAGYERELFANFTAALQYYTEWIRHHDELVANSPTPRFEPRRIRHLLTSRLTYRMRHETLVASLFAFYSPNDEDGHLRPALTHKWSDAVTITLGANVMWGKESTFFGQLNDNSNGFARIRYSF